MGIGLEGQNLIFLISQPRAGSTLTQRILGSHPDIHTVSEPWLMLPPLYALRSEQVEAEYNAALARLGWEDFFKGLPESEEAYFQGLRKMYSYLYDRALENSGKRYFLDKTPRYYDVIPEIYKTFPKARFIILLRNPLAVICSIITTWTKDNWKNLSRFKNDLIKAPPLLLEGIKILGENCFTLHYEQLITNPEAEIEKISDWLEINFLPDIITYGSVNHQKWRFGDQDLLYKTQKPEAQNLQKWESTIKNGQIWRLAKDYLQFLSSTLKCMGYSYEELHQTLEKSNPGYLKISQTLSLEAVLGDLDEGKKQIKKTQINSLVIDIKNAKKLVRRGKIIEAIAAYRKAIELNPKSAWSYFNLGEALSKLQKSDEAIAAYQEAIKLNPNSASFYYNLAEAFMQKGNLDEAIAHYSKAIEIKPTFSIGHNSLGEALVKQGKLLRAAGCFRKAVELNSNYFKAYGNLAELLAEKGQLEEAVGFYQEAIKINPSYQITNPKLREAVG